MPVRDDRTTLPLDETFMADTAVGRSDGRKMAEDQAQYNPYLVGYVALYTNDLATAEAELTKAAAGLPNDPFQVVLLGMTYEKKGDQAKAREFYQKAFDMSTGSNPPYMHSRAFTKRKLGK